MPRYSYAKRRQYSINLQIPYSISIRYTRRVIATTSLQSIKFLLVQLSIIGACQSIQSNYIALLALVLTLASIVKAIKVEVRVRARIIARITAIIRARSSSSSNSSASSSSSSRSYYYKPFNTTTLYIKSLGEAVINV